MVKKVFVFAPTEQWRARRARSDWIHDWNRTDFTKYFRRMIRSKALFVLPDDPTRTMEMLMTDRFKIGDLVSWNSEAGRVSGTILRVHTRRFDVNGYTHHASAEAPQYEIKSSKTEHVAYHKGSALRRLRD
jgi:hypothetical protein